MIMQTAIMLKYRTGNLVAKLEVANTETEQIDSGVRVLIDMENRGNVSYVGILRCRLLDADNRELSQDQINLAVYRSLRRRAELPIAEGNFRPPYHVEVTIANEDRKDLPPEGIIVGNRILYTQAIE